MVLVKILQLGAVTREYSLNDNATVDDLLNVANEDYVAGCITKDQRTIGQYDRIFNGDSIFIGTACKGNYPFEVKLIRLGSSEAVIAVTADNGMTIGQLVSGLSSETRQKFINRDGKHIYEYRIGSSESLPETYVLNPPAAGGALRLVLSTRTKGN